MGLSYANHVLGRVDMKVRVSALRSAQLALVAGGCGIAGGFAFAQPMEVVTVEAARSEKVAQTPYGVPVREITITSRVSYADLDLKTEPGVNELDKRIRETAKSTCKEMDVKFPAEGSGEEACVKQAVEGAMAQAHKVIAAKRGGAPAKQ